MLVRSCIGGDMMDTRGMGIVRDSWRVSTKAQMRGGCATFQVVGWAEP
jgi:hypothetical protein